MDTIQEGAEIDDSIANIQNADQMEQLSVKEDAFEATAEIKKTSTNISKNA